MRKWLPATVAAIAFAITLIPNEASAQLWTFRGSAGYSNSGFYGGEKLLGGESRNGIAAGITADYKRMLGDAWSFEFGIFYVQKGGKGTIEYNPVDPEQLPIDFTFEGTTKLDYLEFSFVFVGHLETSPDSEFRVYTGPYLGNLLSARAEGVLDGDNVDIDIKDDLKSAEWGIIIGLNWTYYWEKVGLTVDFRNALGLTSIVGDEFPNVLKNRTNELLVGITVPLAVGD
ncbi:MAG: PorT family protein [Candidatus Latescibacterota bacterium]|nr:MAG: PorT family protein [Candidatus Latescibacterota bacterium]